MNPSTSISRIATTTEAMASASNPIPHLSLRQAIRNLMKLLFPLQTAAATRGHSILGLNTPHLSIDPTAVAPLSAAFGALCGAAGQWFRMNGSSRQAKRNHAEMNRRMDEMYEHLRKLVASNEEIRASVHRMDARVGEISDRVEQMVPAQRFNALMDRLRDRLPNF